MQPGVKVYHRLIFLIKREVVRKAADLVRVYISCIDLLNSCAEFLLDDSLCEALVVAHHIHLLVLFNHIFLGLRCSLEDGSLTLRLLKVVLIVLGKNIAKVNTLVDQSRLNELECRINFVYLTIFMPAEKLAHEENQVQVFVLFLRSVRVICGTWCLEPL